MKLQRWEPEAILVWVRIRRCLLRGWTLDHLLHVRRQ